MGNGMPSVKQIINGPRPFEKKISYTTYDEKTGEFMEIDDNMKRKDNNNNDDPLYFINNPRANPCLYKAFMNGFGATAVVGGIALLLLKKKGFTPFRVSMALYGTMFVTTSASYHWCRTKKIELEWMQKKQMLQKEEQMLKSKKEIEEVEREINGE